VKKLLLLKFDNRQEECHLPDRKGWEVKIDPAGLYGGKDFLNEYHYSVVKSSKPDFVIVLCRGCCEAEFDESMKKNLWPKGPKYITWSTDDYRHTDRVELSDLHLGSIPSSSMADTDNNLILFGAPFLCPRPVSQRYTEFGIACRKYNGLDYGWREDHISSIINLGMQINRVSTLWPSVYREFNRSLMYSLNIPVYRDSSPNYRHFELGFSGCLSFQPLTDQKTGLDINEDWNPEFYPNLITYNSFDELIDVRERYKYSDDDVKKWNKYFMNNHCLQNRLNHMFKKYYDLDFPLVELKNNIGW